MNIKIVRRTGFKRKIEINEKKGTKEIGILNIFILKKDEMKRRDKRIKTGKVRIFPSNAFEKIFLDIKIRRTHNASKDIP